MFFIHGFWADRKSPILGVPAAPADGKTLPKGGGLRAPALGRILPAAKGGQTPQNEDFQSAQKPCINSPGVRVWVHSEENLQDIPLIPAL